MPLTGRDALDVSEARTRTQALKEAQLARILHIVRTNPDIPLRVVALRVGRSRGTVAAWLKAHGFTVTKTGGAVAPDA